MKAKTPEEKLVSKAMSILAKKSNARRLKKLGKKGLSEHMRKVRMGTVDNFA